MVKIMHLALNPHRTGFQPPPVGVQSVAYRIRLQHQQLLHFFKWQIELAEPAYHPSDGYLADAVTAVAIAHVHNGRHQQPQRVVVPKRFRREARLASKLSDRQETVS
jgi:hypothetical protein